MDSETKRRIDTARDILVGKIPDPKSQVEQITIAMVYKFMDDMDAESEEFGGERKFFAGEFQQYGWAKLMRSGKGGHEMLNLYAEAITRMRENPGIPMLFRDIFKNAYLPYRDPETLRAFLKIIDGFNYDHSENLGDAFEYLLSVMSSQGDAGQFRTPRHIIDFMVEIVDPKKNETVMDPACGTAGFLISSYKHIINANKDEKGNSTLSPEERGRLAQNFKGYDISPDMVRLSLVNMYLHGFVDPHISEYDTLTYLVHWNDQADVILANPPFMSPKGGIKPHNRFSVKSNRSEVLFVDYIAEHLTPNGRAAVIVPEGVIFQSGTAYKQLRKMLVETCLVAVISLPAGVFYPYSGVKTSILVMDKTLARNSNTIGFFKIENDGFSLGAQRRVIEKDDLPIVITKIKEYLSNHPTEKDFYKEFEVEKNIILSNVDIALNFERYRKLEYRENKFPLIKLGDTDIFQVVSGGTPKTEKEEYWNGGIPWVTLVDLPARDFITTIVSTERTITNLGLDSSSAKIIPSESIIVSTRATIGRVAINKVPVATNQGFKNIIIRDKDKVIPKYVALSITKLKPMMNELATGGTFSEISKTRFCELEIPLPPLEIQQEIVDEIESYQKIIDGARMVVDNYRPRIPVNPEWPVVKINQISTRITKGTTPTTYGYDFQTEGVNFVKIESISDDNSLIREKLSYISSDCHNTLSRSQLKEGDVLFSIAGSLGRVVTIPNDILPANTNQALAIISPDKLKITSFYLAVSLGSPIIFDQITKFKTGVAQYNLSLEQVGNIEISLPSLDTQMKIEMNIKREKELISHNRELIALFESKIHKVLSRVWGENE